MANLGFLFALGAALAWGSYMVPFKKSKSDNFILYQVVVGFGILISGLIFSLVVGYPLSLNVYGLISGFLWGCANAISLLAILNLGLSKAIPIISSLVILSSFLWGVVVFGELPQGLMAGFLAIGLIILGVIIVSTSSSTQSKNIKAGLVSAVLAGVIFGSQLAPLKIGSVQTQDFFFSLSLGIFITSLAIAAIKRVKFRKEAMLEGLMSGVIWNIGNLLSLLAISLIGLSKGMPISQSATLVAVCWGIFYFKEAPGKREKSQVLLGAFVLFVGIIVLSLA